MDDLHVMLEDVRKIFCDSDEKESDSFIDFVFATNCDFGHFALEQESTLHLLLNAAVFKLQLRANSKMSSKLFSLFGFIDTPQMEILISKIKHLKLYLKFQSMQNAPNQKTFLNWLF